ncbi:MAG: hypothetical protein AAF624_01600 [Bacteroidota bacterium]
MDRLYEEAAGDPGDAVEDLEDAYYEGLTSLSRGFSSAFYNVLQSALTDEEADLVHHDSIETPDAWTPRDANRLLYLLQKVRAWLIENKEQIPIKHFIWYVDENGKRRNGRLFITLPFGQIGFQIPHDPIVRLVGLHDDLDHRWALRKYDIRIDPDLLDQYNREWQALLEKHGREGPDGTFRIGFLGTSGMPKQPFIEEPAGWLPVEPVMDVLGFRIEVDSVEEHLHWLPELGKAIERCEREAQLGSPVYWLSE